MIRKQQAIGNKKTLNPRVALAAIVSLLVLFLVLTSVLDLWKKYRAIRSHINELKQQEVALKEKKTTVTTTNKHLETEEGKEEVFRNTYRLVKPGEGIILITKDSDREEVTSKGARFQKFWDNIMRGLGLR